MPHVTDQEPNQYDEFGILYDDSKVLPTALCQIASMREYVGDIRGLRILDLACGSGDFSRRLVEWGASHVTAVDLSAGMIEGAKAREGPGSRIDYLVADCSKPLVGLMDKEEKEGEQDAGSYDMVFAAWLLNYAASEREMADMWSNVATHLRPGGRFVGIVPNFEHVENSRWYGVTNVVVDEVADGMVRRTTLHTNPPVTFVNYTLRRDVYERTAAAAGLAHFAVRDMVLPKGSEGRGDYWRPHFEKPTFHPVTAVKALD